MAEIRFRYAVPLGEGVFSWKEASAEIPELVVASVACTGEFVDPSGRISAMTYFADRELRFAQVDGGLRDHPALGAPTLEAVEAVSRWQAEPADGAAGHVLRDLDLIENSVRSPFNRLIPPEWRWDFRADGLGMMPQRMFSPFYGRDARMIDPDEADLAGVSVPPDGHFEADVREAVARELRLVNGRLAMRAECPFWDVAVVPRSRRATRVRLDLCSGRDRRVTDGSVHLRFPVDEAAAALEAATSIAALIGRTPVARRGRLASYSPSPGPDLLAESGDELFRRLLHLQRAAYLDVPFQLDLFWRPGGRAGRRNPLRAPDEVFERIGPAFDAQVPRLLAHEDHEVVRLGALLLGFRMARSPSLSTRPGP